MYALSVKTQKELAFFKHERKKAVLHGEEQPFLIYNVRGFAL